MNEYDILNYLGYPFNHLPCYQFILTNLLLMCLVSKDIVEIAKHSILLINGLYFIYLMKETHKSPRPINCKTSSLEYCPETYDIPSGHSFMAVYWFSILVLKQIPYTLPLIFYLGIIPFTRVMVNFHTIKAVVLGSFFGILWFLFFCVLDV